MNPSSRFDPVDSLPITRALAPLYAWSLVIALLQGIVSAAGLLFRSAVYPTPELIQAFVVTDLVNLVIGVPILLGSVWLTRRGRLVGLLFWPGALFFVVYHAIVYVYAMPLGWVFLLDVIILVLAVYTLIRLMASIDASGVGERLRGGVPERLAGGVLIGLGAITVLRNLGVLISAILGQTVVPAPDMGVMISDFLLVPTWLIGGLLLWRRQALGYVGGLGLLFQSSMLFVGLIAWLILTPIITGAPFVLADLLVISVMGLFCFVPFALFMRGVIKTERV